VKGRSYSAVWMIGLWTFARVLLVVYLFVYLVVPGIVSILLLLLTPQTLVVLLLLQSVVMYLLFWYSPKETKVVLSSSQQPLPSSSSPPHGDDGLRTLLNALMSQHVPLINAYLTFHINELCRTRNPLPLFSEPVVSMSVGSNSAPSFMHLRQETDMHIADSLIFSCDFVLDSSDAFVAVCWLNGSVKLYCNKLRAGGRIFLRLHNQTNEVSVSFESPMWNLEVSVSGSTAEVVPDKLRQTFLRILEERLREWSLPHWVNLGALNSGLQSYLRTLSNLAPYNHAAALAMEAALKQMSMKTIETIVPVQNDDSVAVVANVPGMIVFLFF
jgi:hypothetical protein